MLEDVSTAAAVLEQEAPAPPAKKPRKARAPKHDFKDGRGKVFAHRHINGNGWVEDTAKVADTVFVGKFAQVAHYAILENKVSVRDHAIVTGTAYLRDMVTVKGHSYVGGSVMIYDTTIVDGNARVHGGKICGTSRIEDQTVIADHPFIRNSRLSNHTLVRNYAQLLNATLSGNANVLNDATVLHSTVSGAITIKNSAKVLFSSLNMVTRHGHVLDENGHMLLTDDAMIVGCSDFAAFVHVKGHSKIVGGTFRFAPQWLSSENRYVRLETLTTAVFPNARIRSREEFERYNDPNINTRAGTAQAVVAHLPPMPQPFDFAAAAGRRIMSTEDKS